MTNRNWCWESEVVCWVELFGWEYPVVNIGTLGSDFGLIGTGDLVVRVHSFNGRYTAYGRLGLGHDIYSSSGLDKTVQLAVGELERGIKSAAEAIQFIGAV